MYPTTSLEPGMSGPEVEKLQRYLISQGFMTQAQMNTGPGIYGPQTTAAVKAWQQSRGVDNSSGPGYWGPKSIAAAKGSTSSSSPTSSNNTSSSTPTSSQGTITRTTQPTQPQNGSPLFSAYGQTIYSNATISYSGDRVTWTNPDGSHVWMSADIKSYPDNAKYFQQYAPSVYPQIQAKYPTASQPQQQTPQPQAPTGPQPPLTFLQPGQTGPEVQKLQTWLVSQGYMTQAQMNTGPGVYGPQTTAAVKAWQEANGVDNSSGPGYWGPKSVTAYQLKASNQPVPQAPQPNQPTQPQQPTQTPDGQIYKDAQGRDVFNINGEAYDAKTGVKIGAAQPQPAPNTPNGTPYFMGDYALVKLQGQNQTWLLDTKTHTLRPFESDAALKAVYGNNMDAITAATQIITPDMLAPGGLLGGYEMLPSRYAIKNDGKGEEWTGATAAQLAARYGYPTNDNALEQDSHMLLGGFMNLLMTNPGAGISQSTINKLNADPNAIGFFISALAYGGYTLEDIYRDIKRRDLIAQGRSDLANVQPISSTQTRQTYQLTDAGKAASTNATIAPPAQLGTLDAKAMKLSIYDIPDEAFKTLVPIQDPNSAEFKANMDKVLTPFFDVMMQQLTAQTDQEKALADYAWSNAKTEIERQLGIQLSNNALEAWSQIEQAYNQFASQGIQGSGLQSEQIDDYLRRVRASDQQNRDSSKNSVEAKDMAFYTGFATPQQIKDLIAKDPEKAKAWGLVPSAEILAALDPAALKAKYPNLSDADIARYRSTLIDENGNYRSTLFQKYTTGQNTNADAPNVQYIKDGNGNVVGVNVSPTDTGMMDLQAAKDRYKSEQTLINSLREEEKAYAEFTKPDSPFLRAPVDASTNAKANPGTPEKKYTNLSSALSQALQNVNPNTGKAPLPSTTQQTPPPQQQQPVYTPPVQTQAYTPQATRTQTPTTNVQAPVPQPVATNKQTISSAFQLQPTAPSTVAPSFNIGSMAQTTPMMIQPKTQPKPAANPWAGTNSAGFSTVANSTPATTSNTGIWGGLKSLFGF